ncbi:tyrosine-protein phosphatase [Lactobacillus equicursoris]|uniref:tyrosine-protein phosphatase n=1 Tax=Lactobacillus equicursoris TaxID=420645 RepID=UPI003992F86C
MPVVDLHCHILPGIDDGSKDWATSLKLAQDAVNDGITHAVCTPHTLNGRYLNHKADVIKLTEEFQDRIDQAGIPLTVFPGHEVRLSGGLPEALDNDDILFCDEDGQYMLLELPSNEVPHYTKSMIFQIMQRGITPIIVHPERNNEILEEPTKLQEFLEMGVLIQITASSYTGTFGKKIEDCSRDFIKAGQCVFFASDAHDLPKREYQMHAALDKLAKEFGEGKKQEFLTNAQKVVNGEPVHLDWQPLKKKRKKFLGLF